MSTAAPIAVTTTAGDFQSTSVASLEAGDIAVIAVYFIFILAVGIWVSLLLFI